MLRVQNRLKKKRDFDRVFRKGRVVHGSALLMRVAPNKLVETRVGFAIGTKVDKRAVVRNRIRRRLREVFRRELLPQFPSGFDLVIIAKPNAKNLDFSGLREEARALVAQAGLVKLKK